MADETEIEKSSEEVVKIDKETAIVNADTADIEHDTAIQKYNLSKEQQNKFKEKIAEQERKKKVKKEDLNILPVTVVVWKNDYFYYYINIIYLNH